MVFYLKYRPKTLAELDNTQVADLLGKYLQRAQLPHAFLLTGPKGTGKTSTARILAKSVNCEHPKKGQACGECTTCLSITQGSSVDILEIDAASNRGIDEIRDLREKIKLSPLQLKYKVYIIDEVHMLTSEAFNALLKTLEEPPKHALFILATTEAHKVPETIKSRCTHIDFHKATTAELIHSLKRIISGEKLDIEKTALEKVAEAADGSFRDGAKLLEEAAVTDGKITLTGIEETLHLADPMLETNFLTALQKKDAKSLFEILETLEASGKNTTQFFIRILKKLKNLLIASFTGESVAWKREELITVLNEFQEAYAHFKTTLLPSLPFELAIANYCEGSAFMHKQIPAETIKLSTAKTTSVPAADTASIAPITAKWSEVLETIKKENHSIVGVLRSCRPYALRDGTFTIEAQYKFHAERLTDSKTRDLIAKVIGDVVGLEVKINTVLRKKV